MEQKEVVVVLGLILIGLLFFSSSISEYTGGNVFASKKRPAYAMDREEAVREREQPTFDSRYLQVKSRNQELREREPVMWPMMLNYTFIPIYVTDLFNETRHPRPFYYKIVPRDQRKNLYVTQQCSRRDGRKGRWTVNMNGLWICD